MELIEIKGERESRQTAEAESLRGEMAAHCNSIIDELGNEISGYAFVVWDKSGHLRSMYNASHGPIGAALVPTLVSDALNRHVAVVLASQGAAK